MSAMYSAAKQLKKIISIKHHTVYCHQLTHKRECAPIMMLREMETIPIKIEKSIKALNTTLLLSDSKNVIIHSLS